MNEYKAELRELVSQRNGMKQEIRSLQEQLVKTEYKVMDVLADNGRTDCLTINWNRVYRTLKEV